MVQVKITQKHSVFQRSLDVWTIIWKHVIQHQQSRLMLSNISYRTMPKAYGNSSSTVRNSPTTIYNKHWRSSTIRIQWLLTRNFLFADEQLNDFLVLSPSLNGTQTEITWPSDEFHLTGKWLWCHLILRRDI
jgi:hypothetical protein